MEIDVSRSNDPLDAMQQMSLLRLAPREQLLLDAPFASYNVGATNMAGQSLSIAERHEVLRETSEYLDRVLVGSGAKSLSSLSSFS
jgi:hypothetical protein